MKNKMFILVFLATLTMIYSCKKDKVQTPPASPVEPTGASYPNFSQLKPGNYWIYQEFNIDSVGNATPLSIYDSCYIEKDTMINGKTYFKMVRPNPLIVQPVSYLRDSLHYLVDQSGRKLFSSQDFQSLLETNYATSPTDTIWKYTAMMMDKNLKVVTPAGTFITSDCNRTFDIYPNYVVTTNKIIKHTRYAENIGIVIETLPSFLSKPKNIERRLLRYHVN
jgi:hypothetical protein